MKTEKTYWVENLKSDEELFFVSAQRIVDPQWERNPCMRKEEALELVARYLMNPNYKNVNLYSEEGLNEIVEVWDDRWTEGWFTRRESLFGHRYQDWYESWCKEADVKSGLVKKFQKLRAERDNKLKTA